MGNCLRVGAHGQHVRASGHMTEDKNKGITSIDYNYLNLPELITFEGGENIEFVYNSVGMKLHKIATSADDVVNHSYYDGVFHYGESELQFIASAEGRVVPLETEGIEFFQYEYTYRDHLGNVRLNYSDLNRDGVIDETSEILQINDYYPFGLEHQGHDWLQIGAQNMYTYNGKELQSDFGLNWSDYGARFYDGELGRWHAADPMASERSWVSPYNYVQNNPLSRIDPTGMLDGHYVDEDGEYLGDDGSGTTEVRVIDRSEWDHVENSCEGACSEDGTDYLVSNSTRLDEYGEGINISDETWITIENSGGDRIEPYVENGSSETVFYKPEGLNDDNVNVNPGYDESGAYPISPGTDLYVPVDGVNTSQLVKGNVYKTPDLFPQIKIDKSGSPDIIGITESIVPIIGSIKAPDGGWHKLRDAIQK